MKATSQQLIAEYEAAEEAFNAAGRKFDTPEYAAYKAAKAAMIDGVASSTRAKYRAGQAAIHADSAPYSVFGGAN
jgi:hypothetical protein